MKTIVVCLCVMLTAAITPSTKEWRGIVPLRSTCEDVKRILGVATCEPPIYHLENETVVVSFSERPCHPKWPYEKWNVPPGTVTGITVSPKNKPRLADLRLDERYKKTTESDAPGNIQYRNEEEGVSIAASADGEVSSISYLPPAKDNHLRCRAASDQPNINQKDPYSRKLDEYGSLPFDEEKARLDNLARALQHDRPDGHGYIIAYAGRRAGAGEAQARAERAKDYLVNVRGVEAGRVSTIDGGYREESTVELWIGRRGMSAPTASPTVHPSEVQSPSRPGDR